MHGAPDAPCNGTYVLTVDLDMAPLQEQIGAIVQAQRQFFVPLMGAAKEKSGGSRAERRLSSTSEPLAFPPE